MTEAQNLLSKREQLVISYFQQGMSASKIADKLDISRNAVDQARHRAKRKLGQKLFSKILVPVSSLREKCVLNSTDLERILSETQLKVFVSLKRSKKSWELVSKETGVTLEYVKRSNKIIKEKLGEKYEELISYKHPIEGIVTLQEPKEEDEERKCENCSKFLGSVVTKEGKKVFCSQHDTITLSEDEKSCSSYQEYIQKDKNSDMEQMNEALKDKGFLRMARKAGTGYEPKDSIEKSQYAIAGLGFRKEHFKRRAQALTTLGASGRHKIVVLTNEERGKPEVREMLKMLKLSPAKLDFDEDTTTAHFIIKDEWSYSQLMSVLRGDVDFLVSEEGTVAIFFEYDHRIKELTIKEKGAKKGRKLELDRPSHYGKEHTAEFMVEPGKYTISIKTEGTVYMYELTVKRRIGMTQIERIVPAI